MVKIFGMLVTLGMLVTFFAMVMTFATMATINKTKGKIQPMLPQGIPVTDKFLKRIVMMNFSMIKNDRPGAQAV